MYIFLIFLYCTQQSRHIKTLTELFKLFFVSSHAITSDVNLAETAKAAEFFLADGVIVTGTSTGAPANHMDMLEVKKSVNIPVLIGSGVTLENVQTYIQASGMIIGSYFKESGHWCGDVEFNRVKSFMAKVERLRI